MAKRSSPACGRPRGAVAPTDGRGWVVPVVVLMLLLGVVAGAIVISSVTQRHVQLDDGSVWVTSLKDRKAARFNVRIRQADAAVASAAPRFDVLQHDSDTVLDEGGRASSIKASTVGVDSGTETRDGTVTAIGGGTVAFLDPKTGGVWAGFADDVGSVSPMRADPRMRLGPGGRIAVDADGAVWGYRPSDGMVLRLGSPRGRSPSPVGSITDGAGTEASSFTVVDGVPVIAAGDRVLFRGGGTTSDLEGRLSLQTPPVDGLQSGWVAVAGRDGLDLISLSSSHPKPVPLRSGGHGEPASPVSSGGCVFAAWSQRASNYVSACSTKAGRTAFRSLESVDGTSELVFRANHRQVVLNDVVDGDVWNPRESTDVIRLQWNTVQTERSESRRRSDETADNRREFDRTCSRRSGEIQAEDDVFGARAGGERILDVLRNDRQTDCSVLQITHVNAPDGAMIDVSPVYDGRYLQLDATKAGAGTVTFSYEISDGRGQTSSAMVTLALADSGNAAPAQTDVPPELSVEQGATYTFNALGGFTDPDGDPMTLVSAVPQGSDQVTVSTRADGRLTFDAGSMASGRVGVELTVSDGEQTGIGMVYFSVKPAGTLPADIDPVAGSALPATDASIDLKPYVHATSARPAQLSAADAPDGATVTMNAADLTLRFRADDPGTYYVPYTITQGSVAATGLVRMEVRPASGRSAKPVAANDVALLGAGNTAIVEPLSNDIDPMGGVLSVTSVTADPSAGIKTGLVSHRRVYLTARRMPTKPVGITYTVANAAGTSTGTIVLQPPAASDADTAPKAPDMDAQVRTGGIVSVDVLDRVGHPDGTTVTLRNDLGTDASTFRGFAFVSGDAVRYQASDETGTFPVVYTVEDDLGASASGTITITVHRSDEKDKPAPTPHDAEAQVAAGQKVRIPITLTGIDVDGDDDQLLGLGNKAPQLGRITEVGANYLVYEAYSDSSGTDTFSYAVEDWTGQRAQARIRVGVFRGASDSGVYARDDEVTLRPGTPATVPVTQNDISGDNTDLTLDDGLDAPGIPDAKANAGMIDFTTPRQAGTSYVVYTVRDKAGLSDTGTLTVNVDPDAPIEPPDAYDYRVPSSATVDRKNVDVDVGRWIANPSGPASDLKVDVHGSARDHARVKGGDGSTVITVNLTRDARAVPYTVTNTRYGVTSTAFIQVPAYGVFPPTLRPKAPELKVNAHETIRIDVADYVRVGAGKEAHVDGADSVSATKAADGRLYVNDRTLRFTAPGDYSGPASITFTAVDAERGSGRTRIVNSAVITLPITVVGRGARPPAFSSSTIDVAAGDGTKTVDLKALTHMPDGTGEDGTRYTYSGGSDSGKVDAAVSESGRLTVKADKDAVPGTTISVPVRIGYDGGAVDAGMTVRVVPSTRPLARVPDRTLKLKAGEGGTVNMLDDAYDPFPASPLTVVRCVADEPSEITVRCGASGSVDVTAAPGAGGGTDRVLVTVEDGTRTAERKVTGTITISVVDRPDPPLLSPADAKPQDGAIDLAWTPGSANGSPITGYEVRWNVAGHAASKSCGTATACRITGLENGRSYTFHVRARNEVGWSGDSDPATGMPDKVPPAPSKVSVEGGRQVVTVSWSMPGYDGSPVDYYTVGLSNGMRNIVAGASSTSFDIRSSDITDGLAVTATVVPHNRAGDGAASTSAESAGPYGVPDSPTVSASQPDNGDEVTVTAEIGDMRNNACASAVFTLGGYTRDAVCGQTSYTFDIADSDFGDALTPGYSITTVHGDVSHGEGAPVTPIYRPAAPSGLSIRAEDGRCAVSWTDGDDKEGLFEYTAGDGSTGSTAQTSFSYDPGGWRVCGSVSVRKTFRGAVSADATASSSDMPDKPKARIGDYALEWSDHDTLRVVGGDVETYGRDATVVLVLTDGNGVAWERQWATGEQPAVFDMRDSGLAGDVTWRITLADGPDELVGGVERTGSVRGPRPMAGGASGSLSGRLPENELGARPWIRGLAYDARYLRPFAEPTTRPTTGQATGRTGERPPDDRRPRTVIRHTSTPKERS